MSCFFDCDILKYVTGLLCSCLGTFFMSIQNPTLNFQVGNLKNVPVLIENQGEIEEMVDRCICLSKEDWDSFETSWDFQLHPLIEYKCGSGYADEEWSYSIQDAFDSWKFNKEELFKLLKRNEEKLNRIFIDIYGLQDELTPEVADKDITVYRVFDSKDEVPESMKGSNYILTKHDVMVSLISYAVGCMLGRYSLDVPGLAYAGGEWDESKYKTFIPDADNCIPITDEEYFEDDIVGLFCAWLKKVYGERTLEENLDFIADALGNKGSTSREVIRNYFLNDFIKDHIKTYQKRPIYWLFDSGKQNGFKALCYMHRWNADTTGNMRVEYLHRMQRVYEKEIQRMQEIMDAVEFSGIHAELTPEQYVHEIANNTDLGRAYKEMLSSGPPLGQLWHIIYMMGGQTGETDAAIGITNNMISVLIQVENYLDEKYNFLGRESIAQNYMMHIVKQLAEVYD